MKLSLPKNRFKRKKKPATSSQIKRKQLTNAVFRYVLIFMGVAALGYGIVSIVSGSSLFIPKTANGVLDSVENPKAYTWNSQSVRLFKLANTNLQQDAVRGVSLNTETNKFQINLAGVLPELNYIISDGNYAIILNENNQSNFSLFTDICNNQPAIDASTLEMPSAGDIKQAEPKLITDKATIFGERAWQIDFTATPTIVSKLLWLPFFDQAFKNDPNSMSFVISDSERQKIEDGDFKTVSASALINRSGERLIQQIDVRIEIDENSKYRFMAQRVPSSSSDALDNIDLGPAQCQQ
jgi:hypothetical protein